MSGHTVAHRFRVVVLVVAWLAICIVPLANQQRILDWWKLRGYVAPPAVASLVSDDTMTGYAQHLFYLNKPDITTGSDFTSHCPLGTEKTIVLGCYISSDKGIYLYNVTDPRLQGVVQVTAAHEMLHAAYARLPSAERNKIDGLLENYYVHSLTDQRIKDTMDAYKQSEPTQLYNEMHSVFGTEIATLPPELETYYARYFTDRSKVTTYAANYESEFTSRRNQIAQYDAQLATLKQTIDANEASLTEQQANLTTQLALISSLNQSNSSSYTAAVKSYNRAVDTYNNLRRQTEEDITTYNALVDKRNALALEEQQLMQSLSPQSLPAAK